MSEQEIEELVSAIDNVSFREFWWGSPLLARAAAAHNARVVRSLVHRHHCLGNKEAFSAHAVRIAVCECDGPNLPTLWSLIDAENNSATIEPRMDDVTYLPWAATFIIGEIGGAPAFQQAIHRLGPDHSRRHFLLIRLFSHILVRYLSISAEPEPEVTFIDLKSGESERQLSRYMSRPTFDMTTRKRKEANRLFSPLPITAIEEAKSLIASIPDALFNMPRSQFGVALSQLPVRKK